MSKRNLRAWALLSFMLGWSVGCSHSYLPCNHEEDFLPAYDKEGHAISASEAQTVRTQCLRWADKLIQACRKGSS